ncbi:unnamed protein product [Lactuca virosa]|uniref:Pentatricopeptide repeat-containing protein n=1 Tax=Lactuca virosa TaxID=75947 RepID=A0AAU9NU21_9ASTR|nr:unnamed protein product [Lactuca virosa]
MVCSPRVTFFSTLLNHCLSLESLFSVKIVHAQLIKLSLCNTNTFLGNRCLDLYSKFGTIKDAFQAFDDIRHKNVFSWNIYMRVLISLDDIKGARQLFDEMPERDVVSWNSIISGYSSSGFHDCALRLFSRMQTFGVTPSDYTYSIVLSFIQSAHHGMEIHCNMIRNGVDFSSVIIWNSLIDMYCNHGVLDYAFGVFLNMEQIDIISWNTLIAGFSKSGYKELAYKHFNIMRTTNHLPDAFTISSIMTSCSSSTSTIDQDLSTGKQLFSLSIKLGFLSNTILSSAAIDMFSKCKNINDSIRVFEEINNWDSCVCNSMISSLVDNRLEVNAIDIFALSLNKNIRPTEFTLSCLVSCSSLFLPPVLGTQLHCLVVKLGFENDSIVSSSLVEMYSKCGSIDSAKTIFDQMGVKDLISWNTMILGFTYNGKTMESLKLFDELLKSGPTPDEVTLYGILLACNFGYLINEGLLIFYSMENEYGVTPKDTHLTIIVDLMIKCGRLNEALEIITTMDSGLNGVMCKSILDVYGVYGELGFIENVAEILMNLEPMCVLPYIVLCKAYEVRGKWESVARVKKEMKDRKIKKVVGCSWIGVKRNLFDFKESEVVHHGGEDLYLMLRLMMWDLDDEDLDMLGS